MTRKRTWEVGAVLAFLLVTGLCLLVGLRWYWSRPHPEVSAHTACQANLLQISAALALYRQDWGTDPPILTSFTHPNGTAIPGLYPRYISDPRVFRCPKYPRPESPPGHLATAYGYEFFVDPHLLLTGAEEREEALLGQARKRHQLEQRFGANTTIVWCQGHYPPAAPDPDKVLALKIDGRIVWVPHLDEQEKLKGHATGGAVTSP